MLKYLKKTPDVGLTLCIGDDVKVKVYADAADGVHRDGKSLSGAVVKIGGATVMAKTQKQKIVSKSSTEAELICATDMASLGTVAKEFLQSQGYDIGPVELHQDNTSTISMILNGRSMNARSRHINIRYFFLKERVENGEFDVVHTKSARMTADILSKPLQGALFTSQREDLLSCIVALV